MADQPTSNPPATPSPQKDVVDPQWIEAVFTSLGAMQVELDADPLALGPKRLNGKIAQCRTLLSQCQTIFLDVSQYLGLYRRELRRATADFKLKMKELLSTDPEVRMGRNVADRDAVATTKLRTEQETIDRLTSCVEDLEAVMVVVNSKRSDLKDIQGRLRDQLKVCQEEIGLGGRWGKGLPTRKMADPAGDSVMELAISIENSIPDLPSKPVEPSIPLVMVGTSSQTTTDNALKDLPGDDIPVVSHPDEDTEVFTDSALDSLLNEL